jgi:hypothetical protein
VVEDQRIAQSAMSTDTAWEQIETMWWIQICSADMDSFRSVYLLIQGLRAELAHRASSKIRGRNSRSWGAK